MTHHPMPPSERILPVLALTSRAWGVLPKSPQALARRAYHGYVPQRVWRRLRADAGAWANPSPVLHSW